VSGSPPRESAATCIAAERPTFESALREGDNERLLNQVPFYLISIAPNLGAEKGDLALLTAAIDAVSNPGR